MKNNLFFLGFCFIFLVHSCSSNSQTNKMDLTVVQNLEVEKYMGTWYEIARFPHRFEKDLVGVTATYSIREDGKIKVLNQGYKNTLDGKHSKAEGKAKIPNLSEPGKLKVSFFWFFYADYFVLELDENYQYAMIGSSSPDYFWILCRNPQMDDEIYNMLVENAKNRGYDMSKLIKVEQKK